MSQTLGQYIRSLREARGLTQKNLSKAVGFKSLAHLSDIENGKRNPSQETLPKFAEALGVKLEEFVLRDSRGAIATARELFAKRPEMPGAFVKILAAAQTMDADELIARVTAPRKSPAPSGPKDQKSQQPTLF